MMPPHNPDQAGEGVDSYGNVRPLQQEQGPLSPAELEKLNRPDLIASPVVEGVVVTEAEAPDTQAALVEQARASIEDHAPEPRAETAEHGGLEVGQAVMSPGIEGVPEPGWEVDGFEEGGKVILKRRVRDTDHFERMLYALEDVVAAQPKPEAAAEKPPDVLK